MRGSIGLALLLTSTLSGCFFESTARGPSSGTLVIDWTVGGSKHPAACEDSAADSIDIVLRDADGYVVDEFESPCENFVARVQVSPGNYAIEAFALDPGGYPHSTAALDHRYVGPGETSVSALDFPLDAFF